MAIVSVLQGTWEVFRVMVVMVGECFRSSGVTGHRGDFCFLSRRGGGLRARCSFLSYQVGRHGKGGMLIIAKRCGRAKMSCACRVICSNCRGPRIGVLSPRLVNGPPRACRSNSLYLCCPRRRP